MITENFNKNILPLRDTTSPNLLENLCCTKKSDLIENNWISIAKQDSKINPSWIFDNELFTLKVLDQLLLPQTIEYVNIENVNDGYKVIKNMQVRGAPLIATIGMFSLIVELYHKFYFDPEQINLENFCGWIQQKCDYLVSSRPTAINLLNIVNELKNYIKNMVEISNNEISVFKLLQKIIEFVLNWQDKERYENDLLIKNSISCLVANSQNEKLIIMTICNTGALATSSFGTALGVILHLHKIGRLEAALALETRPYNQGSRLTAYELTQSRVPFYLLADSGAAYAMKTFRIDAILVGADQVSINGDTANKIGTYSLAVLAKHHQIPFYVVTPTSSINPKINNGSEICVEQRPSNELIVFNGKSTAPENCPVWNPAFDITPNQLISGILTEQGNFQPKNLENYFLNNKI